jgi:hypothetical protein
MFLDPFADQAENEIHEGVDSLIMFLNSETE